MSYEFSTSKPFHVLQYYTNEIFLFTLHFLYVILHELNIVTD